MQGLRESIFCEPYRCMKGIKHLIENGVRGGAVMMVLRYRVPCITANNTLAGDCIPSALELMTLRKGLWSHGAPRLKLICKVC
jgi:hypothetical protein